MFITLYCARIVSSYPDVKVVNRVPGTVTGHVYYMVCPSTKFELAPGQEITDYRGICLITSIYADVKKDGQTVNVYPYKSSGTSFSQFEIVEWPERNSYCARRVGTKCT